MKKKPAEARPAKEKLEQPTAALANRGVKRKPAAAAAAEKRPAKIGKLNARYRPEAGPQNGERSGASSSRATAVASPEHAVMADSKLEPKVVNTAVQRLLPQLKRRDVGVNTIQKLNDYSILSQVPVSQKLRTVQDAKGSQVLDRAMGSMCGMGIGDAMGHMFEFLPAQDKPGESFFALKSMKFYGKLNTFGLQYGQWTDDASMGLCMADSLILQRGYDGSDIRARFWCWWNRGYNNAFRLDRSRMQRNSVGLGGNISKSLRAMSKLKAGEKPPPFFKAKGEDAGNGSLMRFAPIAIFFHAATLQELYEFSRQSSYTTHPGIIAAEACSLLAHLIYRALNRAPGPVDAKQFIEDSTAEYLRTSGLEKKSGWGYNEMKWLTTGKPKHATERCWAWREKSLDIAGTLRARGSEYNGYPVSSGYFGSYSLDGLAMGIWAVYQTSSFDEAIAKSINLLGDADSHGSIAGQLAGALYGYSSIHPQFIKWQNRWDEHEFAVRAVLLHDLGLQWASSSKKRS